MGEHNKLRIMFFGDLAFNADKDSVKNSGNNRMFDNLTKLFDQADLIIGNLESPLPGDGRENVLKKPRVIADPYLFSNIAKLNPDILCLANNHIADALDDGFRKTIHCLKKNSILFLGAGFSNEEASRPLIVEKHDYRIGLLNYVAEGTNPCLPNDYKIKLNLFNLDKVLRNLSNIRDKTDIRIVTLHWGIEYCNYPTPSQQYVVKLFSENGADIIVGHHPHTIQPIQKHKKTAIAYSLGNFYFPDIQFENTLYRKWSLRGRESIVFDVTFSRRGIEGLDFHRTLRKDFLVYLDPGGIYLRMKIMQFGRVLLRWNIAWKIYCYLNKGMRIIKQKIISLFHYGFLLRLRREKREHV